MRTVGWIAALATLAAGCAARACTLYWMIDGTAGESFTSAYLQTLENADGNAENVVAWLFSVDSSTGERIDYEPAVGLESEGGAGKVFYGESNPTAIPADSAKVYGVELEHAACMKAALTKGGIVSLASADTVADGCAVKTAGTLTYAFCKKYLDDIFTVSEMEIMGALLSLIEKHKLIAEGAGVLSLAALSKLPFKDKKVAAIVSGGNIDISTISALIDKALIARSRVFCFGVQLPDKPGQLLNISRILAEQNANVIELNHNQAKVTDSFKKVVLEVTCETHNEEHVQRIITALRAHGYEPERVY